VFETEVAQTSALAARQFEQLSQRLPEVIARIDALAPSLLATLARGSSDGAASFAGYLAAMLMGLPTASLPPSLASVYGCTLRLERSLVLAISQSGASPDLCAAAASARTGGALTLGLINETSSPLGAIVDAEIALGAGPERAVAASKTFILSLTAVSHLFAAWARDHVLLGALEQLPSTLASCDAVDWSSALRLLTEKEDAFVVGRGPTLPAAQELALKLKEVCGIHAEATSAAELLHGPVSIASSSMPALVFAGDRHSRTSIDEAMSRLSAAGAKIVMLSADPDDSAQQHELVAVPKATHPLLQPLATVYAAYPFVARLARARGRDPDRPPHLHKITQTR
jgi:glucosamine--fructose-6-phosphate aminotransferase (isomerizing)